MLHFNNSNSAFNLKGKLKVAFSRSPTPVEIAARPIDAISLGKQDSVIVASKARLPLSRGNTLGYPSATTSAPVSGSTMNNTCFNVVKLTLETFEKTLASVPVPGLRGAIGGVLKIIDQFEVNFIPIIYTSVC
jgi:hypothetical protein